MSAARLNGWKEIAFYLGKGVRTVQRWEAELSLPVRRSKTGRSGETIYALTAELDAWQRAVEARKPPSGWDRDDEPTLENGGAGPLVTRMETDLHSQTLWIAVGAGVVLLVLGVGWLIGLSPLRSTASPGARQATAEAEPADYRVDVDTLRVLDTGGHELWSHQFEIPLDAATYDGPARRSRTPLAAIEDLDGDGHREVAITVAPLYRPKGAALFVFEHNGNVRFRLDVPTASVRFGDTTYVPPWDIYRLFITGPPRNRVLWVAWAHHASGNFPCLLQSVATNGKLVSEYWSAGYVETVADAILGGRPVVLVGAANNDHKGASLAVFDAGDVRGSSPAETRDKTCIDCPPGRLRGFLVFPPMEIPRIFENFPAVTKLLQDEDGRVRVVVSSESVVQNAVYRGGVYYFLTPDLTPYMAEVGAEYVASHRQLESTGLIKHPFGDADMAEAWPVRVWKGGTRFDPVTGPTTR